MAPLIIAQNLVCIQFLVRHFHKEMQKPFLRTQFISEKEISMFGQLWPQCEPKIYLLRLDYAISKAQRHYSLAKKYPCVKQITQFRITFSSGATSGELWLKLFSLKILTLSANLYASVYTDLRRHFFF